VGQVDGTFNNAPVPVPIAGLSNVAAVTAGGYHTCVLLLDGTINCTGTNLYGELGNGTQTKSPLVRAIPTHRGAPVGRPRDQRHSGESVRK